MFNSKLMPRLMLLVASLGLSVITHAADTNELTQLKLSATVLPETKALPEFSLTNQSDQNFSNKDFDQHWSLVFFGFTQCPHLCPTTLSHLKAVYQDLKKQNTQPLPQVVFISVDPKHDTPAVMKKYLSAFNPSFIGLTGDSKQIATLAHSMGVVYMEVSQQKSGEQPIATIEHSGTILLIDPQGKLAAFYNMPHNTTALVKDYQLISRSFA